MSRKRVTADGLNLRGQPVTGAVVRVLPRGTTVEVVSTQGGWSLVRTGDGATGYVSDRYLEPAVSWRVARSLQELRTEVNARAPKRSRKFDGDIGDRAHAGRKSDHNVNADGVVTALDLTHDPQNGLDAGKLAEALRVSRDPRIKYVIFNGRMFSSKVQPWVWRAYKGADPHRHHVHISVDADAALYDSNRAWNI